MTQSTKRFFLKYNSKEKLYILSINDNNSNNISIGDICKECNDTEIFSKGKNDEIIIHEPIKIKYNNTRKNIKIDFQHCVFKDRVYFTNCEFNANVFFNHAVFHKYADFHESIFNGIVSFYNATFKSAPNFSTCVFANLQATNFINEYENDKTHKDEIANTTDSKKIEQITNKHKIRYASNARDSFRTIKNVEKEIALKNPKTFSKDWIDFWQLKLYRATSEHHTDLLKIWHTLMVLNGVFGLLFGLILLFSHCQIDLLNCVNRCLPCDYVFCNAGKICINMLLAFMFIVLFFSVVKGKISRFIFIVVGHIASFIILTTNPKYLFPAVTLFDKSANLSHEATISAIYTMLFILVIFSLQKTARKNSIIPN